MIFLEIKYMMKIWLCSNGLRVKTSLNCFFAFGYLVRLGLLPNNLWLIPQQSRVQRKEPLKCFNGTILSFNGQCRFGWLSVEAFPSVEHKDLERVAFHRWSNSKLKISWPTSSPLLLVQNSSGTAQCTISHSYHRSWWQARWRRWWWCRRFRYVWLLLMLLNCWGWQWGF